MAGLDAILDAMLAEFRDPFATVALGTALARLLTAALLGAVIGIDRELRDKPAGLRTHILIALAACLFALVALDLVAFSDAAAGEALRVDPLRLIEAVTAGAAFLAAGAIITGRGSVQGITTGAGMWMAGAIGLTCGAGNLPLAIVATGIGFFVVALMRFVEPRGE